MATEPEKPAVVAPAAPAAPAAVEAPVKPKPAVPAKLSTETCMLLDSQLNRASQARESDNSVVWTTFNVFAAAEAVLLASLTQAANGNSFNLGVAKMVSFAGIVSSLFWLAILLRNMAHLHVKEEIVRKLETALQVPIEYSMTNRNVAAYASIKGFKARQLMIGCVVFALLAWCFAVARFWFGL
jgi:hypothetical protein